MNTRVALGIVGGVLLVAVSVGAAPAANRLPAAVPTDPDPVTAARFSIVIDGVEIAAFRELEGISSGADPEDFVDSSRATGPVLTKLPAMRKPPAVVLTRGLTNGQELAAWHQLVLTGDITAAAKSVSLVVYNTEGTPIARWFLDHAWPSKLEVSAIQAGSSEILMETVTLVAERIQRVAP
jgi:phage tail-like protein